MSTVGDVREARNIQSSNRRDIGLKDVKQNGELVRKSRKIEGSLAYSFRQRFGSQWQRFYNILEKEDEDETKLLLKEKKESDNENRYEYLDKRNWSNVSSEAQNQASLLLLMNKFYYNTLLDKSSFPLYDDYKNVNPENLTEEQRTDIIDSLIEAKTDEIATLRPWVRRFRMSPKTAWAEDINGVIERAKERLEELRDLRVLLYRVHLGHLWYAISHRSESSGVTPVPIAMVRVFTYTRSPPSKGEDSEWSEEDFDNALDFLESHPSAFSTLGQAKSQRKAQVEETGYEEVDVDPDEKPEEYDIDELRYYVAFYGQKDGVPYIRKEYWGYLDSPSGDIHPEEDEVPRPERARKKALEVIE